MKNTTLSKDLRDLADFFDAHPGIPTENIGQVFYVFTDRATIEKIARIGMPWQKEFDDNYGMLKKRFGF